MCARKYWIGFNHVAGVGPVRLAALRDRFSSLKVAWHADSNALRAAGLDRRTLKNLLEARRTLDLDALQRKIDGLGATTLTLEDSDYPKLLGELPGAPPLLYVRGALAAEDEWAVAIVGTRKASNYGRDTAYELAAELTQAGVTIVSGLALGIDAAAHRGALDANGRTIAVLPGGIDVVYPPEHRKLAREIMRRGALLTEFPPGTQAEAKNFSPRNRIISGLSLGVIVVEAPIKSGALLTVGHAAEQGREVFAVPGRTTTTASEGANRLIQDGAKLVMTVDDVLSELNLSRGLTHQRLQVREVAPETDDERLLLQHLGEEPLHVDELCRLSGLPVATVSSALTLMMLKGMVREVGGMSYTLARGLARPQ